MTESDMDNTLDRSIDSACKFFHTAVLTGLPVKFLEALKPLGGSSEALQVRFIHDVELAVCRLIRAAADSIDGRETYTREFDQLGVKIAESDGILKAPEKLFSETAAAIDKQENESEKAASVAKLFGRAGIRLVPFLKEIGKVSARSVGP